MMKKTMWMVILGLLCCGCVNHTISSGGLGKKLLSLQYESYEPQSVSTDRLFESYSITVQASKERPTSPVEPSQTYLTDALVTAARARGISASKTAQDSALLLAMEFSRYVTRQYRKDLFRTFIDAEYFIEPLNSSASKLSPVVCSLSGVASTPEEANRNALDKLSKKIFSHQATRDYIAGLNLSSTVPAIEKPQLTARQVRPPSELLTGIPRGQAAGPDDIAVVIGNLDYSTVGIPNVDFAIRDAAVVRRHLETTFGFPAKNILYVENASYAKFTEIFGNDRDHRGRLFRSVRPGVSRVFIYYVGHGAPDLDTGEAYFVPVDASPRYLKTNGYRLKTFYSNLSRIPAKDFMIVLDSCFSGDSAKGMLFSGISSIVLKTKQSNPELDNALVFTSSKQDQVSSWHEDKGHSLFTYYFLKGLRGEADTDNNRILTGAELSTYLQNNVPYMAGRLNSLDQTPTVTGNLNKTVLRYN